MNTKVLKHFKTSDPILHAIILEIVKTKPDLALKVRPPENYFEDLCESIVSQQLSVKAGDTIFKRFRALFKNGVITPKAILKIPDQKIRAAGLSNAKVKYVKDLAYKINSGEVVLDKLNELSDDEVIVELTKIKGIGKWTAEMFLMSSLAREDIFSHGDLGLINAIKKLYKLDKPTKEQVEAIAIKWSPFRTFASRILWRSLEITSPNAS